MVQTRKQRVTLAVAVSAALVLMASVLEVPMDSGIHFGGSLLCIVDLLAANACRARARRMPEEARSWTILSWAWLVAMAIPLLIMMPRPPSGQIMWGAKAWVMMAIQTISGSLQALAVIRFPLNRVRNTAYRILGTIVFAVFLAVFIWGIGDWNVGDHEGVTIHWVLGSIALRITLAGSTMAYALAEDPRRVRGPMGWLLASTIVLVPASILSLKPLSSGSGSAVPVSAVLAMFSPVFAIMAAYHTSGVEPKTEAPPFPAIFLDSFLMLPMMASAAVLLYFFRMVAKGLLVPFQIFIIGTGALVTYLFVLLRELRRSEDALNARVLERTKALEEAQSILVHLERANSLGLIGSGLAQDLNKSFSAMGAALDPVMEAQSHGVPAKPKDLMVIKEGLDHSLHLAQKLISFTHPDPGPLKDLELRRVLEDEHQVLKVLLPGRINLEVCIEGGPFPIKGDRGEIQQALVNLVSNAKDAIGGTGTIRVGLSRGLQDDGSQAAILEVSDSGTGITHEDMAKLFQPFFTTKGTAGTGLGLVCVKAAIERVGGDVKVTSGLGSGTTFTLRFPIRNSAAAPEPSAPNVIELDISRRTG